MHEPAYLHRFAYKGHVPSAGLVTFSRCQADGCHLCFIPHFVDKLPGLGALLTYLEKQSSTLHLASATWKMGAACCIRLSSTLERCTLDSPWLPSLKSRLVCRKTLNTTPDLRILLSSGMGDFWSFVSNVSPTRAPISETVVTVKSNPVTTAPKMARKVASLRSCWMTG